MLFEDTYRTISEPCTGEFRDKGSKFLAFLYPIQHEKEVKPLIENLQKLHPKANHHCYAYRLGLDKNQFRVNDDGEPSGTAGRPILNTLYSKELTNVLVVVVRYFGGTLLGVQGLINAYKTSTENALSQAKIIEKTINDRFEIAFDIVEMNDVMKLIKAHNVAILQQRYDNTCIFQLAIRLRDADKIIEQLKKIESLNLKFLS